MRSLTNMSGQFNTTIQQEINGQSTAPIGGTTTPSTGLVTSAAAKTTTGSSTTGKPASATSTSKASGADRYGIAGLAGFVDMAASLFCATFL